MMEKSVIQSRLVAGLLTLAILVVGFFVFPLVTGLEPTGGSVTHISSQTAPNDTAGSLPAIAGNVTAMTITAFSTTQSWQGFFGNVTGTVQLADALDNVLYNWTLASPEGEVYASTNVTINWTNIQCFNFTATGSGASDIAQAGATSLFGTNLTTLESRFNIASDDVDGVNETFSLLGTHDAFFAAQRQFTQGECLSTLVFGDGGAGVDNEFEEILMYEPTTSSVLFVALIEESSVLGFDDGDHDFEMLVLEDGHGTNVATTTYYFWVELE